MLVFISALVTTVKLTVNNVQYKNKTHDHYCVGYFALQWWIITTVMGYYAYCGGLFSYFTMLYYGGNFQQLWSVNYACCGDFCVLNEKENMQLQLRLPVILHCLPPTMS